jgi:hypothetical protein
MILCNFRQANMSAIRFMEQNVKTICESLNDNRHQNHKMSMITKKKTSQKMKEKSKYHFL